MVSRKSRDTSETSFVKENISIFAVAFAISFTIFVYAPLEMFFANQKEFWFSLKDIAPYCAGLFAAGFLLITEMCLIAKRHGEKTFAMVLVVLVSLLCYLYIQGNFLVSGLPQMDGAFTDWNGSHGERLKSIAAFVICLAVFLLAAKKFGRDKLNNIVCAVSLFEATVLASTILFIGLTTEQKNLAGLMYMSNENRFTFSKTENVIILGFDTVSAGILSEMFREDESYSEIFDGFTFYDDAMSNYEYTRYSVPLVMGGRIRRDDEAFYDYVSDSIGESPLMESIRRRDYRMGMYIYSMYPLKDDVFGQYADNLIDIDKSPLRFYRSLAGVNMTLKLAGIKFAPWDLKRFAYDAQLYSDNISETSNIENAELVKTSNYDFYKELKDGRSTSLVENRIFKYIFLDGAHVPYVNDKDVNLIEDGTYEQSVEATLTICREYFEMLKKQGVYDNSAIVVLSDHGKGHSDVLREQASQRLHPIFIAKGFGERGELKYSSAPISTVDFSQAISGLMNGKSGKEIFDIAEDATRKRYLYLSGYGRMLTEYVTEGKSYEIYKLKETGKSFEDRA